MKTPAMLITPDLIRATARQVPVASPFQAKEPRQIQRPCETAWQRKWLQLDCWNPDVQRIATEAEKFAGRWFRNRADVERLLVFAGHTGCGKTHTLAGIQRFAYYAASAAAAEAFWPWPPSLWFCHWPQTARQISENASPMESILRDATEAGLLLLDDIGAESDKFKTGETTDALCQLLSRRAGKWTLVTTNIQPVEWPARFDVRIADRLHRDSRVIDLSKTGSYALR